MFLFKFRGTIRSILSHEIDPWTFYFQPPYAAKGRDTSLALNPTHMVKTYELYPLRLSLYVASKHDTWLHCLLNLDAMSSCDGVKTVDQDSSALALADPDQGLPGEAPEAGRFTVLMD